MRSSGLRSDRTFANTLTTVLSWNFAATILALLFEATYQLRSPPAVIAAHFVHSFVYSNCIGMLVGFAVLGFTPWIKRQRVPANWLFLTTMILSLTFIGSLAAGFVLMGLGMFSAHDYSWMSLRRMGLGFLLALVFGIGGYLYEGMRLRLKHTTEELRAKTRQEEIAHQLAVEARLSSLQSRVQPHFLFNTLNSISSLIDEDPALAERLVERLAALLRFALESSGRPMIPLQQELKIAADYLEIETTRYGKRLQYEIDVSSRLNHTQVPPFVIQTLVENSVEHVSRQRTDLTIQISAALSDGRLAIQVSDNGPGFNEDAITAGHGLDNLRARLSALFAGDSALELTKHNGAMLVTITLPAKTGSERDK